MAGVYFGWAAEFQATFRERAARSVDPLLKQRRLGETARMHIFCSHLLCGKGKII